MQVKEKEQELSNAGVLKKYIETAPSIEQQFLSVGEASRPGEKCKTVKAIVIHFVDEKEASSHFSIGTSGEILQNIPLEEISLAVEERKTDTISIVCRSNNATGKMKEKTYDSLVHLTAWLVGEYDLKINDIIRHHDVTGKLCPKYFVEHESAWVDFKLDVEKYINTHGVKK